MEHLELPISPNFEKNENLSPKEGETDVCVSCNKPLNPEGKFWVHMSTSWKMIPNGEEVEEIKDQGLFPLGNACAKKISKDYKEKICFS